MKPMRSNIVKLGPAMLLAAVLMRPAMAAEGRTLPPLALADSGGVVVTSDELRQPGRWMLLLLDASMASSQSLLSTLARKTGGYDGRLVVVVSGDAEPAQAFIAANQKLQGIRWLTDPERGAAEALGISATPVLLALDENNQIGWQLAGQPKRGSIASMLAQWLRLSSATGK